MNTILVQRSHDTRFAETVSDLERSFDVAVTSDDGFGDAIERNRRRIGGAVLFHLTDASVRAVELLLNERFNAPTTPVAYLGRLGKETRLPYAVTPINHSRGGALVSYLSQPRRISVLIVEDDPGIRDVLRLSLARHYAIDVAKDGVEALRCIREAVYDIVVLDVMLPRVNGDDVFRHLRETSPDTAVLIITAHDTEKREIDYVFGGADGYLAKPFDSNQAFRQKVIDAIRHHHDRATTIARSHEAKSANDAWEIYSRRLRAHV